MRGQSQEGKNQRDSAIGLPNVTIVRVSEGERTTAEHRHETA
jgi:hypothetical protein